MKKNKKRRNNLIILVGMGMLVISLVELIKICNTYEKSENLYDVLRSEMVSIKDVNEAELTKSTKEEEYRRKTIHWDKLKKEYPDVVAWIEIPALDESYPVLQGKDNSFYLNHAPTGEYLGIGSLFLDCNNSEKFIDSNSIIYGHNLKTGRMFGALKQFKNQNIYDGCCYFWIYTPDQDYLYQIFSLYETDIYSDSYKKTFKDSEEFIAWSQQMKKQSVVESSWPKQYEEGVVTLSTCTGKTQESRMIVQGIVIASYENKE